MRCACQQFALLFLISVKLIGAHPLQDAWATSADLSSLQKSFDEVKELLCLWFRDEGGTASI
jgi:hypothetical protein